MGTGEAALMGAEAVGARGPIGGRQHLVTHAARRAGEAPSAPHPARRDGRAGARPTPRAARAHVLFLIPSTASARRGGCCVGGPGWRERDGGDADFSLRVLLSGGEAGALPPTITGATWRR